MAVLCLTAEYVALNASDLKTWCKKAELTVDVAEEDVSTFASAGWKEVTGGQKSGQLALTFNDDFAAAALDGIIWPLLGTVVSFEVRPTQGVVSATNPKYTGSVLVSGTKFGGEVAKVAEKDVTFSTSGAVARATA